MKLGLGRIAYRPADAARQADEVIDSAAFLDPSLTSLRWIASSKSTPHAAPKALFMRLLYSGTGPNWLLARSNQATNANSAPNPNNGWWRCAEPDTAIPRWVCVCLSGGKVQSLRDAGQELSASSRRSFHSTAEDVDSGRAL